MCDSGLGRTFFFPQVEITIINKINIDKFKYDMCEFLINDTIRGIILYFF